MAGSRPPCSVGLACASANGLSRGAIHAIHLESRAGGYCRDSQTYRKFFLFSRFEAKLFGAHNQSKARRAGTAGIL